MPDYYHARNQAQMLALGTAKVRDYAIRDDVGQTFQLTALPASTLGNWQLIPGAGDRSVVVKPGTPPAIPDTSGATLAALEIEVNKLKALMRTAGLIT